MQKNKHDPIHTGNQPGKADFPITSLLPVGKENAISTADLVKLSGCSSSRELQQHIAYERNHGAIICSGSRKGYWKPKDRQEIVEFCRTMEARAVLPGTIKEVPPGCKPRHRYIRIDEGIEPAQK